MRDFLVAGMQPKTGDYMAPPPEIGAITERTGRMPHRAAPVAQWIEYCPPKAGVAGSIPAGRAKYIKHLALRPGAFFLPPEDFQWVDGRIARRKTVPSMSNPC
jgi:hypothetical protein